MGNNVNKDGENQAMKHLDSLLTGTTEVPEIRDVKHGPHHLYVDCWTIGRPLEIAQDGMANLGIFDPTGCGHQWYAWHTTTTQDHHPLWTPSPAPFAATARSTTAAVAIVATPVLWAESSWQGAPV